MHTYIQYHVCLKLLGTCMYFMDARYLLTLQLFLETKHHVCKNKTKILLVTIYCKNDIFAHQNFVQA